MARYEACANNELGHWKINNNSCLMLYSIYFTIENVSYEKDKRVFTVVILQKK